MIPGIISRENIYDEYDHTMNLFTIAKQSFFLIKQKTRSSLPEEKKYSTTPIFL